MNKSWLSLSINTNKDNQSIISSYFDYYSIGNQINEDDMIMYFLTDDKNKIQKILNDICDKYNFVHKWGNVEFENWMNNWKESFKPIKIADKVMIIPDWDDKKYNSDYIIKICPAMAFGTGHHESTQLVIEQMIKYKIGKYSDLLDLGTGSGILSILAKKMGIEDVTPIDIDPLCEENFYKNCELSNIEKIDFHTVDVHDYKNYDYDVILANIDKKNIVKILSQYQQSRSKAMIILAGLLKTDFDEIKLCMNSCYIENVEEKGEWISLLVKNRIAEYDK